jgi:hypothetical protein
MLPTKKHLLLFSSYSKKLLKEQTTLSIFLSLKAIDRVNALGYTPFQKQRRR